MTSTSISVNQVTVGDRVKVDDPWSFVQGAGTVTKVEPWVLGSTAVTVELDSGGRTRTYPVYLQPLAEPEVETAQWCVTRGGYADSSVGCDTTTTHVHYEVQYDVLTGRVLTPASEQATRRAEATR